MPSSVVLRFTKCIVIASFFCFGGYSASAQETTITLDEHITPESYECTQLTLDEVDEGVLTKREILERMDQSLKASMERYEDCVAKVQQNLAAGGGAAAGGGSGSTQSDGEQGNEAQQTPQTAEQQVDETTQVDAKPLPPTENSGAKRGIVAPKDNDSIICKLLYDEIQNAPPDKVAGFEKQYRDYKCGK